MRGQPSNQLGFSSFTSTEQMVERLLPADHPLRTILKFTNEILKAMDRDIDALYAKRGRDSIPPEYLLKALLWQALFSIRSERLLMDVLQYDIRCRWFVGLPLDKAAWDHSTFSANRDRLRLELLAEAFFRKQVDFLRERGLISDEHLSVDGTILEAWASQKSMFPKSDGKQDPPAPGGRNAWKDFKNEKRSNSTVESKTDGDARIARKNGTSVIGHLLSVVMENRSGFAVSGQVVPAMSTKAEQRVALVQLDELKRLGWNIKTVGADRGYADDDFILGVLKRDVEPHVAARDDRPNGLAHLLRDLPGYGRSLKARMFIESIFGWAKTVGGAAQPKLRGHVRLHGFTTLVLAACNMCRFAGMAA